MSRYRKKCTRRLGGFVSSAAIVLFTENTLTDGARRTMVLPRVPCMYFLSAAAEQTNPCPFVALAHRCSGPRSLRVAPDRPLISWVTTLRCDWSRWRAWPGYHRELAKVRDSSWRRRWAYSERKTRLMVQHMYSVDGDIPPECAVSSRTDAAYDRRRCSGGIA